MTKFRRGP